MWAWISGYRHAKGSVTRETAEAHILHLRAMIQQVRQDLADLQDDIALLCEDLDGVTRQVERVSRRVQSAWLPVEPVRGVALTPATFTPTHRQREEVPSDG